MLAMPDAPTDDLELFARRLRLARIRIFKSRARLGRASGIPADTIRTYENARNYPHNSALKQLVNALGVSADWLLFGYTNGLSAERLALLSQEDIKPKVDKPL